MIRFRKRRSYNMWL